jgi:hypothetical protein
MLITGYYEFEIIIKKFFKSQCTDRKIYRRYSDIEWLQEGLLKLNPGCRIQQLPEKSVWCNLNVNNNQMLENRKKHIEEYLNYINNHKYLSQNPYYTLFIIHDFDKSKLEVKQISLYDKLAGLKDYLPEVFSRQSKMSGLSHIEDNNNLEKERENLVRLMKAVNDLNNNMVNPLDSRMNTLR